MYDAIDSTIIKIEIDMILQLQYYRIMLDTCCSPTCCSDEPVSIRETVRSNYAAAVTAAIEGKSKGCCGDPVSSGLYDASQIASLPEEAILASFGCGNPTALAELRKGEVVLDLGSGGGVDVLLSAGRVGPTGFVFGLDMTDEMLSLAHENKRKSGLANVAFLKGEIESIPLPDHSVDVIISNCVINLSADKDKVLREAKRVLKPGGRFAVSDVVTKEGIPAEIRESMRLWTGCIAGALTESDYAASLRAAGFSDISLEPTRVYTAEDARQFLGEIPGAELIDGKIFSAFVRARA